MSSRDQSDRLVKEAADWHVRMQEPSSEAEVTAFEAWLARDPAHPRAYAEIDAVNTATASVSRHPEPSVRSASPSQRRTEARARFAPGWRRALAASLVLFLLVSAALLWKGTSPPAFAAITNPEEAVRGVRLSDGTVVWLDTRAEIGVRLTEERRELSVEKGRVRLVPGSDPRPLEVHAGMVRFAPGAKRFDVIRLGDEVTVAALDGPLRLQLQGAQGASTPVVERGRALKVDRTGPHAGDIDPSWPASRLGFRQAALGRVIALANRQSGPDIVLGEQDLGNLRVSGVFDLRDTRRLARKIAATFALRIEDNGTELILRR